MSSSAYETIVAEKLKLKGVSLKRSRDDKKKKKKKSKKKLDKEDDSVQRGDVSSDVEREEHAGRDDGAEAKEGEEQGDEEFSELRMTEAERRFLEAQRKRMRTVAKHLSAKTHRQKVEEFNQYLSNLSEHHDIPRISAAGNG